MRPANILKLGLEIENKSRKEYFSQLSIMQICGLQNARLLESFILLSRPYQLSNGCRLLIKKNLRHPLQTQEKDFVIHVTFPNLGPKMLIYPA